MKEKRRDKGDGSIYQRKDGLWVSQIQIGKKADGKANVKMFYGKTEQEVKKKLKNYKHELIKNDHTEVKKITVKQYMDNWLYNIQINELKPKSFDRKETTLKHQIYEYIGNLQINNLSANDIQDMINKLIAKGLSYSTIKKAYNAVNGCFKLGVIKGEIIKNPCLGVSLPKKIMNDAHNITFFNDAQIEQICKESTRKYGNGKNVYRLGQAITLLLYKGMRSGECLSLQWDDIDFEKRTIYVKKNVVLVKNRNPESAVKNIFYHQDSAKTASGKRIIYLNNKALSALEELYKLNGKNEYVMSNSNGNIVNPRNLDRMFRNILTQCKIPLTGVHTLRHTFASMLFKKGIDVKTVSELLGHSDVSITYNTYIHLIKEQKQQAISLLDEL